MNNINSDEKWMDYKKLFNNKKFEVINVAKYLGLKDVPNDWSWIKSALIDDGWNIKLPKDKSYYKNVRMAQKDIVKYASKEQLLKYGDYILKLIIWRVNKGLNLKTKSGKYEHIKFLINKYFSISIY